jgi:hypothetical protein
MVNNNRGSCEQYAEASHAYIAQPRKRIRIAFEPIDPIFLHVEQSTPETKSG